ncbi:MAG: hypothetical protein AB7S26_20965 [Sandaracinaceae bacterium]
MIDLPLVLANAFGEVVAFIIAVAFIAVGLGPVRRASGGAAAALVGVGVLVLLSLILARLQLMFQVLDLSLFQRSALAITRSIGVGALSIAALVLLARAHNAPRRGPRTF